MVSGERVNTFVRDDTTIRTNAKKKLEPYPIALSLFFVFTILYIVCIGLKLILVEFGVEGTWHMHKIWSYILPGFNDLSSLSILVGLVEVSLGSYFLGYIIVPIYNYLAKPDKTSNLRQTSPMKVRFASLFTTLVVYVSILFSLCLLYDLVVPSEYQMVYIWSLLLPGFSELSFSNYLIGIFDIIVYSAYTAFIFTITFNYFEITEIKKNLQTGRGE